MAALQTYESDAIDPSKAFQVRQREGPVGVARVPGIALPGDADSETRIASQFFTPVRDAVWLGAHGKGARTAMLAGSAVAPPLALEGSLSMNLLAAVTTAPSRVGDTSVEAIEPEWSMMTMIDAWLTATW